MSTYTSGPWFVNGPWHIQAASQPEDTRPRIIAQVINLRPDTEEGLATLKANARLIAASPDLLDASLAALRLIDSLALPTGGWPLETCQALNAAVPKLRAAIAKAEGRLY